jgi:hypothetical protein
MKVLINLGLKLILASILLNACEHNVEEKPAPVVNLNFISPVQGALYHTGDTVRINAIATSTDQLHGYDVYLKNSDNGTIYFFQHIHDHNDTLLVNEEWKNNLTTPTAIVAEIKLVVDHDGNTFIRNVAFRCEP